MCEEPQVDQYIMQLKQLVEEKDAAIDLLRGRIDGVGTKLQFLLERLNSSVIESRLGNVNNNYDAYELKLDKLCRRIDLLEQNLNQYFKSS